MVFANATVGSSMANASSTAPIRLIFIGFPPVHILFK